MHVFQAKDRVLFSRCEGQVPATIERVCEDGKHVILKVDGWLGTHWEPISACSPMPDDMKKAFRR